MTHDETCLSVRQCKRLTLSVAVGNGEVILNPLLGQPPERRELAGIGGATPRQLARLRRHDAQRGRLARLAARPPPLRWR